MKQLKLIFALLTTTILLSQNIDPRNTVLAEFIVKDLRIDDVDYTKEAIKDKNKLFFYREHGKEEILLSNFWENLNSESYGLVYDVTYKYYEESEERYEIDEYKFFWSYENTYDDNVGTCEVTLKIEYKPKGKAFDLKMVTESLEELHYRGEFKGNMDFVKFLLDKK